MSKQQFSAFNAHVVGIDVGYHSTEFAWRHAKGTKLKRGFFASLGACAGIFLSGGGANLLRSAVLARHSAVEDRIFLDTDPMFADARGFVAIGGDIVHG